MIKTNYKIRLITFAVIGILITLFTFRFKYKNGIFDDEIYFVFIVIIIILWVVFIVFDFKQFRKKKNIKYFTTFLIGIAFLSLNIYVKQRIQFVLDKPTLLRVFYDGDFNGTGFDFKTDGTYIYDDWAIGFSDYKYGKYSISGNTITLDEYLGNEIVVSKRLEIKHAEIEELYYLYQTDSKGEIFQNNTKFRVVIDNRNE